MARAAVARGLPTMLLEQNAVPSRVTRWFARSAAAICTSYPETASLLPPDARVHLTGFPVPPAIASLVEAVPAACRPPGAHRRRLLVLGGNFCAASLNQVVPAALARSRHELTGWHLVHQTGAGQLQAVESQYQAAGIDALSVCFIDELAHVLGETDLAVCRPGGTTLAELAVAGVPALLLPHPDAADDYQLANAKFYAAAGGCRLLDERTCEGHLEELLAGQLERLLKADAERSEMARAMRNLSHPEAVQKIALLASHLLDAGLDALPLAA
jgi:UDP-N-acetylglucosamine--N-acetylmuramyl-(pentapeptide) pyrophosphoryl-undecaprenol N-acetylglucosamine transferase